MCLYLDIINIATIRYKITNCFCKNIKNIVKYQSMTLQQDYTLQDGNYRILKVLGQGGFGITYLAIQVRLDRKVAIKEFFMKNFCERNETTRQVTLGTAGSREIVNSCRKKFLKEAKHIALLDHPNIIRIIDVFDENSTSYYVMEYIEGGSLSNKLGTTGLSMSEATRYIFQVAEALNIFISRILPILILSQVISC